MRLRSLCWMIMLWVHLAHYNVIANADEHEHVHIKVHMPDLVRQHVHHHKQHRHYSRPRKQSLTEKGHHETGYGTTIATPPIESPIDMEFLTQMLKAHMTSHATPMLETIVATSPNYGPALFDKSGRESQAPSPNFLPKGFTTAGAPLNMPVRQELIQELISSANSNDDGIMDADDTGEVDPEEQKLLIYDLMAHLQKGYNSAAASMAAPAASPILLSVKTNGHPKRTVGQRKTHKRKKYGHSGIGESHFMQLHRQQALPRYTAYPKNSNRYNYAEEQSVDATNANQMTKNGYDDYWGDYIRKMQYYAAMSASTVTPFSTRGISNANDEDFEETLSAVEDPWNGVQYGPPPLSYQDIYTGAYSTPSAAIAAGTHQILPTRAAYLKWRSPLQLLPPFPFLYTHRDSGNDAGSMHVHDSDVTTQANFKGPFIKGLGDHYQNEKIRLKRRYPSGISKQSINPM